MTSPESRKLLQNKRLLLVTDPRPNLTEIVRAGVRGGVGVVQLRDKHSERRELFSLAEELRDICAEGGALFTVNDDVELARLSGASGVHLGQEDGATVAAREVIGKNIVGRSVGTLDEAREALEEGADYLGAGAVFPTPTKPDGDVNGLDFIRSLSREMPGVPFYAIGGVTLETAPEVAEAGAWGFAVVRAVLDADDPEVAARNLRVLLP